MSIFNNARALQMSHDLMRCRSMRDVITLLRRVADTLPCTKPGASQNKRARKSARRAGQENKRTGINSWGKHPDSFRTHTPQDVHHASGEAQYYPS
jgi:hypothetical protein